MTITTFITVQSIIIAGLLTWAQLWNSTYEIYEKTGEIIWHVSLTMAVLYTAVFFSMISIISAVWTIINPERQLLPRISASTAIFSFGTMLIIVVTSVSTLYPKAWLAYERWQPMGIVNSADPLWSTLIVISLLLIFLILCFIFIGPALAKVIKWKEMKQ